VISRLSLPCPSRCGAALLPLLLALAVVSWPAYGGAYLTDTNLGLEILAPPPEPGSVEQAADLAEVEAVHQARTRTEEDAAHSERRPPLSVFTPAIGPVFDPGKLPRTTALFKHVGDDTAAVEDVVKHYWKRARPYQVDTNLSDGDAESPFTSYPSGHSTHATVYALILADLLPEHRDPILAEGRLLGWHRVIIAKHYPTDIYAGRVLGQAIYRELITNADFERDFAAAKAEIAVRAGGPP
jgi:acid phosphatase (class A)